VKPSSIGYALLFFLSLLAACEKGHLRGSVEESPDGNTYLAIANDSDGACRPIFVDGVEWPHALNVKAEIEPGTHSIGCGLELEFEIPEGVVFYFDYWGP
jgi:hypothetical protein